jgi:hypothetical protein
MIVIQESDDSSSESACKSESVDHERDRNRTPEQNNESIKQRRLPVGERRPEAQA